MVVRRPRLAFETNRNGGQMDVCGVGANGTGSVKLAGTPADGSIRLVAPATKIAYTVESGGQRQIWVMNADGSQQTQLTSAANFSENPNWSPDGRRIVFDSDRAEQGNLDIYSMNADGSDVQQLTDSPALDAVPAYSPNGTRSSSRATAPAATRAGCS